MWDGDSLCSKKFQHGFAHYNQEIFNVGEIEANPPRSEIDENTQTSLENFSRTASGGAFVVSQVPALPLPDLYPPSQITDLEATPHGDEITLTWTAPGDDFDVGKGKDKVSCGFDLSERRLFQQQGCKDG